jgi:hypothetical protein
MRRLVARARWRMRPVIDRASPSDLAMLAMDAGPLPQQVGAVLLLDAGPDFDSHQRVAQTLESRSPQPPGAWESAVGAHGGWPALAAVAAPSPRSRLR